MRRFTKRMLSLFLSILMVLSSLTVGLTAFADQVAWDLSKMPNPTVNGTDITDDIINIAKALMKEDGSASSVADPAGPAIENIADSSYKWNGNALDRGSLITDNAEGDGYIIAKSVFNILFAAAKASDEEYRLPLNSDYINTYIVENLKAYMGEDWNEFWNNADGSYEFFNAFIGAKYEWPGSNMTGFLTFTGETADVIVDLNEDYYLWNAYGDDLQKLTDILVTEKAFSWKAANEAIPKHKAGAAKADLDAAKIRVRGEQLKAFGNLFSSVWNDFHNGNDETFSKIDPATRLLILTEGNKLFNAVLTDDGSKAEEKIAKGMGSEDEEQTVQLAYDMEATSKILRHFFYADAVADDADIQKNLKKAFAKDMDSFYNFMLKDFISVVDGVKDSLYNADGSVKSDLDVKELREIKNGFESAYGTYNGLTEDLQQLSAAKEAKSRLDGYYFSADDSAENPQTFVGLWNNAVAQSYIDVAERLEYCSDIYSKNESNENKSTLKNQREADSVKELLDEADSLYAELVWEDLYEAKHPSENPEYTDLNKLTPNLQFDSVDKVYTGIDALKWARDVHKGDGSAYGAQVMYERYLLGYFFEVAHKNLDEYLQGDELVIHPLSEMDIIPIRAKIEAVENAFNQLPEKFKNDPDVLRYASVELGSPIVNLGRPNVAVMSNNNLETIDAPNQSKNEAPSTSLNDFDFSKLAELGEVKELADNGDKHGALEALFTQILATAKDNRKAIDDILKSSSLSKGLQDYILKAIDDKDSATKLADLYENYTAKSSSTVDWSFLTVNQEYKSLLTEELSEENVENAIGELSDIANNAITQFVLSGNENLNLKQFVESLLYTKTVAELIRGLINKIYTDESFASVRYICALFGVDFTGIDISTYDCSNINNKKTFVKALAEMLAPFEPLINWLVRNEPIDIAGVFEVSGADGYGNAVKPLLEYALGASKNLETNSLEGILNALLTRVEEIADAPVEELLGFIPSLVNFIDKGGIQKFADALLHPLVDLLQPIVDVLHEKDKNINTLYDFIFALFGVDKTLGVKDLTWDNITDNIPDIVNNFLKDIKIGDGTYTFTVNSLDFEKIASCGKNNADDACILDGQNADTFVAVFTIVWDIVQENKDEINKLLETVLSEDLQNQFGGYIKHLLDENTSEDFVKAVANLFAALNSKDHAADWSFLTSDHKYTGAAYPNGMTSAEVQEVVDSLSAIVEKALSELILKGEYDSLADFVGGKLYTQSLIDTVKNAINGLAQNETVAGILPLLGIELSVNEKTYTVTDKESFIDALADILAPFEGVLNVFLNSGELSVYNILTIKGADGFNNAVKPLLEYALGAKNVNDGSLKGILTALLGRVEEILDNPLDEVLGTIPMLANFIDKGGVQKFVEELLYPVINVANAVLPLLTDENLFDFIFELVDVNGMLGTTGLTWENITKQIPAIVNGFLKDLKIGDGTYTFTVNSLDFAALAGCGTANGLVVEGNDPDTFVTLFNIVWDIVQENRKAIDDLIGTLGLNDTISDIVNNLLNKDKEDVVEALLEALTRFDSSGHIADWKFLTAGYVSKSPVYPDGMTSGEVQEVIDLVSSIAENALKEFILNGDYATLADFVGDKLYTQSLVDTVKNAINGLAQNETVAGILPLLGIELGVNEKTYTVTGKVSFINALADILAPFEPVIDAILNEGELNIAGVVTLVGSNGFENAVKPLLEYALGAKNVNDGSLKGLLTAVLDRVDEILNDPVEEVLGIVPMLTNFINKGGVQKFVEELLYPVLNIAEPVLKLVTDKNLFDFVFDLIDIDSVLGVKGVTWANITDQIPTIVNGFLKGIKIGDGTYTFTVNSLDFAALAACGKANGLVVNGNKPDTFVTLFDIIWNIVQENRKAIDSLVKSLGLGDTVNGYIDNLLDNRSQDIVKAIVKVLKGFDASSHKADWSFLFKNYKTTNVKYPNGVKKSDIDEVIAIISEAVENALEIFLDASLPNLVSGLVYTNDIANSVKGLINSLAGNGTVQTVFGLLGVELKENNKTYNVTDKASFINALADILSPFEPLVDALLNKGAITIANVVTIKGADGFNNAIKPLLEYALGCSTVKDGSLKGIITAVLNRADEILADPVVEVIDILPALSNFIGKGGVQYFVEELLYPVLNIADAVLELITKDSLFDFVFNLLGVDLNWSNAQNELIPFANSLLTNIKINGKSYSIKVPEINWSKLGGCGKLRGTRISGNTSDALMTVLGYVFKALEANKNVLYDLVGGKDGTVGQIVTNVLKQGSDGLVKIIVDILLKMDVFDNVTWVFRNIKELETKYTENYGEEDYSKVLDQLDSMIGTMLPEQFNISLSTILNDMLFKNSLINTVAKLIYTNIEKIDIGIDINKIFEALDLDVTTRGVAALLSDFGSASAEIGKHAKWSDVNFDAITWNFKDGDKDGFIKAISAVLRPIQPVLRVILSGEDLVVLGSVRIKGGNGYNTAIIPLLEALGVSPSKLVSPQQYAKEASTDKVLTNILNPIFDKVEELLQAPLRTLCEMLPNIAYFLYNGGALALVENLAGPVFNILDEISPIYNLNLDLSMLADLDLDELINSLLKTIKIKDQPLNIQITNIDLSQLAGRGELVSYRSARTYYGRQMDCKKINADVPAVFISVLRYIIENLQVNLDAINGLLAGVGLSGDIADIVNQVLGFLVKYDVDGVIEALMEILADSSGGGEGEAEEGVAPYPVGSFGWIYWVILACITLFLILILIIIIKKKEKYEEEPLLVEGEAQEINLDELKGKERRKAKKAVKKAQKAEKKAQKAAKKSSK